MQLYISFYHFRKWKWNNVSVVYFSYLFFSCFFSRKWFYKKISSPEHSIRWKGLIKLSYWISWGNTFSTSSLPLTIFAQVSLVGLHGHTRSESASLTSRRPYILHSFLSHGYEGCFTSEHLIPKEGLVYCWLLPQRTARPRGTRFPHSAHLYLLFFTRYPDLNTFILSTWKIDYNITSE